MVVNPTNIKKSGTKSKPRIESEMLKATTRFGIGSFD